LESSDHYTASKSYAADNEPNKTWMKIDLLKISVISNIFSNFNDEKHQKNKNKKNGMNE